MNAYSGYLIETLVTLVAVCGLAFVVLWGARRLGLGRASGPLALRGHLPLDARRAIYLVQAGDRIFVVGVGEGGFTKLGEMPASELPAAEPVENRSFADALSRAFARAGKPATPSTGGSPDETAGP